MTNNKLTLPVLFTVAVLVAGVFAMGTTFEDAEAAKPNPKVKPFKCSSSGTFSGETLETNGIGNCSHMGKTISEGNFVVTPAAAVCLEITSTDKLTAANGDQVYLTIEGTQCFFDAETEPIIPSSFCGVGAYTSTVEGTYTITGGDGRFFKATGSGDIYTDANHCDEQPNTDTFESTISGTIEYAASNRS